MNEIEELPYIDVNNVADNQDVYNLLMDKINELTEELNRLNRVNMPVTNIDDPDKNCKWCNHEHIDICKCECGAVR